MKTKMYCFMLFCGLMVMSIYTGCSSDDPIKDIDKPPIDVEDAVITLKETSANFTNQGGTVSILFETNVDWTIASSKDWCKVLPTSGTKGSKSVAITTSANEEYDDRSCTVTIKGGNVTKTITINQGENLGLLVSPDRYELDNDEATIEVEVKANVEFEVVIDEASQGWIERVEARGLVETKLLFLIAKNNDYDGREGTITIRKTDGTMASVVAVFQSQRDAIILSERSFDLSGESQTIEVEVKTNVDFEVIIDQGDKNWVMEAQTRALRTETLLFDIAKNETAEERTAVVFLKNSETSVQDTLTIHQATFSNLVVDEEGGTITEDDLLIEVPQGAFAGEVTVEIAKQPPNTVMEGYEASDYYELKIPKDFTKPLKIKLPANTEIQYGAYFCFAAPSRQISGQGQSHTVYMVKATKVGDVYEAYLDPFDIDSGDDGNYDDENITIGLVKNYYLDDTNTRASAADNYTLTYPLSSGDWADFMNASVREAIKILESIGYGFDKREYPINIVLKSLGNDGGYGYFEQSMFDKWNQVIINDDKLRDESNPMREDEVKRTLIHELAHLSQSYFDTRSQLSKAKFEGDFLWMDEAIAVWTEGLYVGGVSSVQKENQLAPLHNGFFAPKGSSTDRANHGYGMAGLINWLAKRSGAGSIVKLSQAQMGGAKSIHSAFSTAFPSMFDSYDYASFLIDYVRAGGVDGMMLVRESSIYIEDNNEYVSSSSGKINPYSACVKKIAFDKEMEIPYTIESLKITVEGGKGIFYDLLKLSSSTKKMELISTFEKTIIFKGVQGVHNNKEALYVVYYHPYPSQSDEPITVKAQLIENRSKITLTTAKDIGESIYFNFDYDKYAWVDINNNGVEDDGEITSGGRTFTVASKTFSVYGDFTEFVCGENDKYTVVDASGSTNLERLICSNNLITSLDVRDCKKLVYLNCSNNKLGSIDLSNNRELSMLVAGDNELTSLKLAENGELNYLFINKNKLTALSMSSFPMLQQIACEDNELTSISVSGCEKLVDLFFNGNSNLASIDVDNCDVLKQLDCKELKLTSLNVTNCPSLYYLNCRNNQLTTLDVSSLSGLKQLYCHENQLTSLEVSGCMLLEDLWCYDNNLTSLSVNGLTALKTLKCERNKLTSLDVDGCTVLNYLNCEDNGLLGIVPKIFDDIYKKVYDVRYIYEHYYDKEKGIYWWRVKEDTGKGWWYDHEPEGGVHAPKPRNPI